MMSSKFHPMSSSILLIRPIQLAQKQPLDFQILFLKRTPGLYAGGFFAFPGGQIEDQDHYEPWQDVRPEFIQSTGRHYHDFNKRITCIREMYEECNLLVAKHPQSDKLSKEVELSAYESRYENRFPHFCRDMHLDPQLDRLYALTRVATPGNMPKQQDTQFYVCLCDHEDSLLEQSLVLRQSENTDYDWLTVDEAIKKYQTGQMPMFPPQIIILSTLKFLNLSFDRLKVYLRQQQTSPYAYLTNRGFVVNLSMLAGKDEKKKEQEKQKQTSLLFSDYDLLSDAERQADLHIYTDETYISQHPELAIFSKNYPRKKNHGDLQRALESSSLFVMYHDFMSMQNSVVGYRISKNQRQRTFTGPSGLMGKIFRVETSKSVLNLQYDPGLFGKL